jgi:hypothetical protein
MSKLIQLLLLGAILVPVVAEAASLSQCATSNDTRTASTIVRNGDITLTDNSVPIIIAAAISDDDDRIRNEHSGVWSLCASTGLTDSCGSITALSTSSGAVRLSPTGCSGMLDGVAVQSGERITNAGSGGFVQSLSEHTSSSSLSPSEEVRGGHSETAACLTFADADPDDGVYQLHYTQPTKKGGTLSAPLTSCRITGGGAVTAARRIMGVQ